MNGTRPGSYQRGSANMMNVQDPIPPDERTTALEDVRPRKVGGWLAFFCFVLVFGNPFFTLPALISQYKRFRQLFDSDPGMQLANLVVTALVIGIVFFGMCVGVMLYLIKRSAPKMAKCYLIGLFVFNMLVYVLALFNGSRSLPNDALLGRSTTAFAAQTLVLIAWYSYLTFSKRVKRTYGLVGENPAVPDAISIMAPDSPKRRVACPACKKSEDIPSNRLYDSRQYQRFSATTKRSFGFLKLTLTCKNCGKTFIYEDECGSGD
jgi:Protein of unknown function (DUF2569)